MMKNPHFGKWLVDDDPGENFRLSRKVVSDGSWYVSDGDLIAGLQDEKSRLRGLLKVAKDNKLKAYDSFLAGEAVAGAVDYSEILHSVRSLEGMIREVNFKIRVLQGKARV